MTDEYTEDFADFLINAGNAAVTIGPWLIFLGRYLRTGSISKDDAINMIFTLLGPIIFPEFVRWSRKRDFFI